MKLVRLLTWIILFGSTVFSGYAQRVNFVRATGRAQHKKIVLRWAVSQPRAWKLCNQYGFDVVRFTVVRDDVILEKPERKPLGEFKPTPLQAWNISVNENEYAAIIAQALYGESFEVGGVDDTGVLSSINKGQELEQRFSLSLFAADMDFTSAQQAGWGLTDVEIKENEKYLYRIKPKVPKSVLVIDSTAVFIGLKDYKPLPEPTGLAAEFLEKSVLLSWDYTSLKSYYNAYFIERSSDGRNFYKVTKKPIMRMSENDKSKTAGRIHYVDTLGMTDVTYYYRVRGYTLFGEVSPPSDVVSGIGKKVLAYTPHIVKTIINENGVLELDWTFPVAGNSLISGFTLNQSQSDEGPFLPVMKALPTDRSLLYTALYPSNYFTITADAVDGISRTSLSVLVQPLDSIPPQAPIGVKAVADSTGVVTISWTSNGEKDLKGYKVFRALVKDAEPTPIVDSIHYLNHYVDTVSMKIINRKVYYFITALDQRYNQSDFSVAAIAMKPDIIPPTSPLFTKCTAQGKSVVLHWSDSHDDDVAEHLLYRRQRINDDWKLIKRFGAKTSGEYSDQDVAGGNLYVYTMTAKDSSALESKPSTPVSITVIEKPGDLTVNAFDVYIDRENRYVELFWRDDMKDAVEEYQLYKGWPGVAATLWKIVKSDAKRIVDEKLTVNTEYRYGIRVVTKKGQVSKIKWLDVKY